MKKIISVAIVILIIVVAVKYIVFDKNDTAEFTGKSGITLICYDDLVGRGTFARNVIKHFEAELKKEKIGFSAILIENKNYDKFTEATEGAIKSGAKFIAVVGEKNRAQITLLSEKYPDVNFEVIGTEVEGIGVSNHIYKDEEAAFLAGYVAAKKSKTKRIGFIGIEDKEYVNKYKYGYIAGAKYADEKVKVKAGYLKNNTNKKNIYTFAENFLNDDNIDVIYEKTNDSKEEIIKAASNYKKWIIPSDIADEDEIDENYQKAMLVWTTRNVNSIGENIIAKYKLGSNEQTNTDYGLLENGVDLIDENENLDKDLSQEVEEIKIKIGLNEIEVPKNSTELENFIKNNK